MPCRISDRDVTSEEFTERLMSHESRIIEHSGAPRRLLCANSDEEGFLIGLVQLDRHIEYNNLHCSIMWVNERREGDPLWNASRDVDTKEGPVESTRSLSSSPMINSDKVANERKTKGTRRLGVFCS